jgi:uncharacterized membrane protein HdeD (DUF308 family)
MSNAPTWKVAVIGAVAVTAGCALVVVNWTVPQLAAFLAMLFIARGALHLVTTSFEGMPGALSALLGLGEVAVGLVLLIWPSATVIVIVVVVGVWTITRAVTLGTNILATRRQHPHLRLLLVPPVVELAGGLILFARASGSVRDVAVVIGALMIVDGITELLLAIEAQRHAGRGPESLVASS